MGLSVVVETLVCYHWFVVVYRTMSVKLQQNPSMLERGSELTSPRNSGNTGHNLHVSAYEKALLDLAHDKKLERDLAVGRQVGFYRIRGELGSGNFSQVKLGIHILTRGKAMMKIDSVFDLTEYMETIALTY